MNSTSIGDLGRTPEREDFIISILPAPEHVVSDNGCEGGVEHIDAGSDLGLGVKAGADRVFRDEDSWKVRLGGAISGMRVGKDGLAAFKGICEVR